MEKTYLSGRITAKTGDITSEIVNAIVNAANSSLLGGSGVDGAIHSRGGPAILEECREIRRTAYPDGLPTGRAVITTAGELPSKFVIHTVGPIFGESRGTDAELLADCYRNSIRLAAEHSLSSIAFPAISTGVYGYPKELAAEVSSLAIAASLEEFEISEVRLVYHSENDLQRFIDNCRF